MFGRYETPPQTLRQNLTSIRVDELKTMVKTLQRLLGHAPKAFAGKRLGSQPASHRKPDIIDWLQFVVLDPQLAKVVYTQMNDLEKSALGEVVHSGSGQLDPTQISAKYGQSPALHDPRPGDVSTAKSLGIRQVYCPLLSIVLGRQYQMAKDVQELYQTIAPKPAATRPVHEEALPESLPLPSGETTTDYFVYETEQSALVDVQAMLNLVAQGKIGVGAKTGRVSKAGARVVWQALSQGDFYPPEVDAPDSSDVQMGQAGIKPFAWPLLLQAGKLAQIEGNKLALTRSGRAALKKKPQEVLRTLWERWLKTTLLHEMNRIEVIKGQKSKKHPLYAARTNREILEEALTELDLLKWIPLYDFFKFLFARGNEPEIVRNDWALYILDPEHGSFGYSHIHWDMLTGRFVRAFLLEYAATLGLIDVALVPPWGSVSDVGRLWGADDLTCLSRYDGLLALRLTPLGDYILGLSEDYTPPRPPQTLEIVSDQEIRVRDGQQNSVAVNMLERFCSPGKAGIYGLNAVKAMQAVEQGMAPEEMRQFLRDASGQALPEEVRAFFQQVEQRSSLFRIAGQALLVECSDPQVLHSVLHDNELRKLCLPAGEGHVVVRPEDEKDFKVRLHKLGYALPLV